MKIVVIGGTGLIGSKVIETLPEHGHEEMPQVTSPSPLPKGDADHECEVLDTGDGIPPFVLADSEYPSTATEL